MYIQTMAYGDAKHARTRAAAHARPTHAVRAHSPRGGLLGLPHTTFSPAQYVKYGGSAGAEGTHGIRWGR